MSELHVIGTKALLRSLKRCPLGAQQTRILDIIGEGRIVPRADLLLELWSVDPEGGPTTASRSLDHQIWLLRQKGYPINTHHGRGLSMGGGMKERTF